MSDTVGVAIVELRADIADLKKGMLDAVNSIKGFSRSSVAEGTILGHSIEEMAKKVVEFSIDSVKAYGQQQIALTRLSNLVGKDATNAFKALADQLQKTTGYNDDAVLALQAQLANYGILPGSIGRATEAALDFAAATGKDLPEAGAVLGQALAGQGRELKKYGLELSTSATRSANLEKTLGFLENRFKGSAALIHQQVLGAYDDLNNSIEDFQKVLGKLLDNEAKHLLEFFTGIVQTGTHALEAVDDFKSGIAGFGTTVKRVLIDIVKASVDFFTFYVEHMPVVGSTLKLVGVDVEGLRKAADKMFDSWQTDIDKTIPKTKEHGEAAKKAGKQATGAIENEIDAIKQLNDELEAQKQIQQHITEITRLETEKRIAVARNSFDANASYSQALRVRLAEDAKSWGTTFAEISMSVRDQFASAVADMIVHGGRFRDVMKQLGQSILQTFIEEVVKRMVASFLAGLATMKAAQAGAGLGAGGGLPGAGVGGVPGAPAGGGLGAGIVGTVSAVALTKAAIDKSISMGLSKTGSTLGGILQGPLGAFQGGFVGNVVNKVKKAAKKLFSGGVLSEPTILMGTKSGAVGLAGEDGPEALTSFKDMGLTPNAGRNRLMGSTGAGGGGGGGEVHVHFHGTFIEGSEAKMQEVVRRVVVPEIKRYTQTSNKTPFLPTRGART